jgi:hypothetical protein
MSSRDIIDARIVFLARAAARHALVEAGEMELDEALDGLVAPTCCCRHRFEWVEALVERWEREYPPLKERGRSL